jgi:hypothetical protein
VRHKDVASEHQKSEGCRSWPQQAAPKRVGQVNNTIAVSYEVSMLHKAVANRLPHRTDCLHQPNVEMPWSKSTMKVGRPVRGVARGLLFGVSCVRKGLLHERLRCRSSQKCRRPVVERRRRDNPYTGVSCFTSRRRRECFAVPSYPPLRHRLAGGVLQGAIHRPFRRGKPRGPWSLTCWSRQTVL